MTLPSRAIHITCWATLLSLGAAAAGAKSPDQPAYQLHVAGDDTILWLVVGRYDEAEQTFVNRFAYREPNSDKLRAASAFPPQLKQIDLTTVADRCLYVFYVNQAHCRYTPERGWRAHQLPEKTTPKAIAGQSTPKQSLLWAVVEPEVAAAIDAEWQQWRRERASQPDPAERDEQRDIPELVTPPGELEKTYCLVSYDGLLWRPGFAVPADCFGSERVWLCAGRVRHHLFWQKKLNDTQIEYARHEVERWTRGEPIVLSGVAESATVGLMNTNVVFAALVKQAGTEKKLRCEGAWRPGAAPIEQKWTALPTLQGADGAELRPEAGWSPGLFAGRLVLARMTKDGPQVGMWDAFKGGPPQQPFQPIPLSSATDGQGSAAGMRELAAMLVVALLILLVFWRRQAAITSAVPLPAGLLIVGPGRRILAFLIDALPALMVISWIWYEPIMSFYQEVQSMQAAGKRPEQIPESLTWAWVWFRVIYVSYSMLFELFAATTPGKRLLGCFVLSETLERPSPLQVAVRNVFKLVELEPMLKIWPFLLVVFFTRNRQRLGDLLARTIVVERQAVLTIDPRDPNRDRDADEGE